MERDGAVATLFLARGDRMNALLPWMMTEAAEAIDAAVADGARALVITGDGRGFCAGADLSPESYGEEGVPTDFGALLDDHFNPFVTKLAGLDIPVITAVNGAAVGAGLGLALTGDLVLMARSAYLLLAFVNMGLVPDMGATWAVANAVGRPRALEMALFGEKIDADGALKAGLVTRIVDDAELLATAQGLAAQLAAGPSIAIGMIRKQVAAAFSQTLAESMAVERHNQTRAGTTRDFKEAVAAFAEKRKPVFEGR